MGHKMDLSFPNQKHNVHFCKLHHNPDFKLDGSIIPVVDQYKFLGFIFNRKLFFIPHIKYLKIKCNKAIQLLRVVAHMGWEADRQTLLKLYIDPWWDPNWTMEASVEWNIIKLK